MPFLCNACSEVIGTSCGIHEHVATRHSGVSLCECFHCHGTGLEIYFQNFDDLAKHSAIKHANLQLKVIQVFVRSREDENKLCAFIVKHINEIGQDQVTTSHKNVSSPVGKQEVVIPVTQSCVEDRTDNTMQTFDSALVRENNESIVRPVPFQSNQVNIENVAAAPANTVILENRNVAECASVVVKTETSPNLACGQVPPSDNQAPMQDQMDSGGLWRPSVSPPIQGQDDESLGQGDASYSANQWGAGAHTNWSPLPYCGTNEAQTGCKSQMQANQGPPVAANSYHSPKSYPRYQPEQGTYICKIGTSEIELGWNWQMQANKVLQVANAYRSRQSYPTWQQEYGNYASSSQNEQEYDQSSSQISSRPRGGVA